MNSLILQRSRISRRIMLRYILSLIGFVLGLILFVFICWFLCGLRIWYDYEPLYKLLVLVESYLAPIMAVIIMIGWAFITYRFMNRPLRYLDEIVNASGQLITSREEPVRLSAILVEVEQQLNRFRLQGLQAETMAREAEQRKNDLIIYLAHDLKTPLTSIIGYLSLLQDEPQISPELRARYTGIALDKALRLEELTNEFFDITRFNLTTLTLEAEQINLSRMLEQITYEFLPVLADKGLSWQLEIQPEVQINGDPDKLQRVFDNLIRNAVNYSYADTTVCLMMRTANGPNGSRVEVQISNRGRTIPPEKLSRIFEQFFRLDSSRSSATGGAGLGLAISKEIIELHGGGIQAESADERIVFSLWLPLS